MVTAFENALVVRLDALHAGDWPTWGLTTTTAKPWKPAIAEERQAMLRHAERMLFQRLRRDYGRQVEYLGFVEFTTGRSASSGGDRRAHVHHLVKGLDRVDQEQQLALEQQVSALWKTYTQEAWRVECRPLRTPIGAVAYLALHHHKHEQRPPRSWKGKRFRPSQGYFARPVAELRDQARELIRDRRIANELIELWKVPDGFDGALLDELLGEAMPAARARALASKPTLHRLTSNGVLQPVEPAA
jgi:hypothetical protein